MVTISRASLSSVSHHHRHFISVISTMFVCRGVDSLHFRAVWILSTRLLSVVKFVLRCSGLFVCSGAMGPHSAQVSLESSSSSSSALYGLKCPRPTSQRSNRSEFFLDAHRGAMRNQALGVKSTGGASQTPESWQYSLPGPPTAPRPTTPASCGASQPATFLEGEEFTHRLAADGLWYEWAEFAAYYREDAPAMWRAAWQRELRMAIWPRLISIRWRNLVHSMALRQMGMQGMLPPSWRAAFRGAVLRQLVDQRLDGGPCPRLVPAEDSRRTSAVPNPWDDYLDEEVDGPAPPYPTCNASRRLCACSRGCTVPVFGEQVVCDFCSVEMSPQPHCVCVGVGYECCEHDLSDGGEKAAEE